MKALVTKMRFWLTAVLCCSFAITNAQITKTNTHKPETELHPEIFWDIKAYSPDAELLQVVAIAQDGKIYDVKAIQYAEDSSLLDVKVLSNGERLPVKLILNKKEDLFPLNGIDKAGNLISIKALTEDGKRLDVRGVRRIGNTIAIRAIGPNGSQYSLLAMAPDGMVNTIKGLKMASQNLEMVINGIEVFAHVKAMCDIEPN
ncbi:hypothetical protein J4050_09450 [Winogradskyella sp. DF17]|uniref:DUF7486 domain-containing protein n=1 Tax=Winogradskyella pelagia TaxID=2819984 RepID=A0ABS3T2J5_9FLAO|nr:hypothetical protein [Winogradskyella sp. DF17]MBO3116973.1 hypothetical protein [Winogradskyella sp. DF17]